MSETRRKCIAFVTPDVFEALLSGEASCVNWPAHATVRRIMFDPMRDQWVIQIEAPQFVMAPEFEALPLYELLFEKHTVRSLDLDFVPEER